MPSTNTDKSQGSKKRLGRGLGSLLTTQPEEFDKVDTQKPKNQPEKQAKEPVLASPTKQEPTQPAARPVAEAKKEVQEAPVQAKPPENKELNLEGRVLSLPVEKVQPNKNQPRKEFAKEALEELANSIKTQGVLQPISVRKIGDSYQIIAGERRWRASQIAGLKEVPAIIKNVDDKQLMELALIENLQREDLNPIEEAMGYQQLMDEYDLTQSDLSTRVGKNRSTIANSLRILSLPKEVRQWVQEGALSLGHAKVLLSLSDTEAQKHLGKKAMQRQWSVRTLEMEIKNPARNAAQGLDEVDVGHKLAIQLATQLQKSIGTKVGIQYKKGKGKLEIHFYSDDELSNLYQNLKEALSPYKSKSL